MCRQCHSKEYPSLLELLIAYIALDCERLSSQTSNCHLGGGVQLGTLAKRIEPDGLVDCLHSLTDGSRGALDSHLSI